MDRLLTLRGDVEHEFWISQGTARQAQLIDSLGLWLSLAINIIIATLPLPVHSYRLSCAVTCFAIPAQLLWRSNHPRSYIPCRIHIQLAHRIRFVVMTWWLCTHSSTSPWEASLSHIHGTLTAPGPVTWRAFAAVAGYPPFGLMNQSLSFPLPFRYALASSLAILACYPIVCLRHQLQAVELLSLLQYAHKACMATPVAAYLPPGQQVCTSRCGQVLVLAHVFVLVGVVFPMQLVYWQEKNAKEQFLRSRGVAVQGGGSVPLTLWVTLWALVVLLLAAATA